MKPGLWEITTQMSGAGMPARPAMSEDQRKKMEAMGIKMPGAAGGGMGVVVKHCITKEQAANRQPPQSDENARQKCEQKDVKVSGNTTTWKIECTGERKMTGTGSITYHGEENYQGESTFNTQDAKRGPTTMKQSYSGKWLAANCK
ncbi:MAG: DUF3617 domain-containing protein [Sulfuritalea sp.]|nr:DUF3617 domain-containing protein [Sulfuritalea sp.]